MTEIEKIERAKMYIEKLANGIDPITDTNIPEGDVVNNIRIARCFFYVAEILGKVIEQGGLEEHFVERGSRKIIKAPFSLTAEQADRFEFSLSPISASEICQRLGAVIDTQNVKNLSASNIFSWLESIGALIKEETDNGNKRTVTQSGVDIGIVSETRISSNGNSYTSILFNKEAQLFIIDNTAAIANHAAEKKEERKANKGEPWTRGDELLLIKMYEDGYTVRQMSQTLKRTCGGVRGKMKKMGLVIRPTDE